MQSKKRPGAIAVLFAAVFLIAPVRARTQDMVVGVNVVNPMRASVANQNTLLGQLKAAQVHVIRCGRVVKNLKRTEKAWFPVS
jgi:hypothetical protein